MRSILAACIVAGIAAVVSGTAQARVDFDIGIGIPGYAVAPPPPPVYYQPAPVYVAPPAPVVVAPGYYDDWQARRAWQEQQWRERRWREREWRERHREWHRWHDDYDD
ncbi:hypothetical protein [Cupriavidus pinatubonensis]|uniref:Uncharacterized protein n=1 Tax=Cupriavidus pinatubonensis TaxID=248026 RepID=A0ABM8Y430_9BURK|nr:hypothetical protein [Cupriavidus pinatubonensis]CAG9187523.1 hypothetical protein LMG23994_06968 [Cupriavidus pinatubonensis]